MPIFRNLMIELEKHQDKYLVNKIILTFLVVFS